MGGRDAACSKASSRTTRYARAASTGLRFMSPMTPTLYGLPVWSERDCERSHRRVQAVRWLKRLSGAGLPIISLAFGHDDRHRPQADLAHCRRRSGRLACSGSGSPPTVRRLVSDRTHESGYEALQTLRELKLRGDLVAVLLADHRMPEMSGLEFLEEAMDLFPAPAALSSPRTPTPTPPSRP